MSARDVSAKAVADDLHERAEACTAKAERLTAEHARFLFEAEDLQAEAAAWSALADRIAHLDTPAGGAS